MVHEKQHAKQSYKAGELLGFSIDHSGMQDFLLVLGYSKKDVKTHLRIMHQKDAKTIE
jgi:hypothetical protein